MHKNTTSSWKANNLAATENGFNPKQRHVAFHRGFCHVQNNCFLRPTKCTTYPTGSSLLFSHELYPEQSVHEINRAPSSHHTHHHRHRDHLHHRRRRVRFTEHRTHRVKGTRCPETHIRISKHAHKTTNTADRLAARHRFRVCVMTSPPSKRTTQSQTDQLS